MKSKKLSLTGLQAISLALSIQLLATSASWAVLFSDVQGHWAQQSISQLSDRNILGGYPDNTFRPEGRITRAEFSAMLVKALALQVTSPAQPSFNDVSTSNWAYPSIETVRARGLVSGYPGGYFYPNQNISKAEATAILVNSAHLPLPNVNETNQILGQYGDSGSVPNWARPAFAAAIKSGIVVSVPGNFNQLNPLSAASRGEVAVMTQNLLSSPYAQQPQSTPPLANNSDPNYYNNSNGILQGRVSVVPSNTRFTGTLTNGISSEVNRVGDSVTLQVNNPLISQDGQTVVPVGSQLKGQISQIESAGRTGKNATMGLTFQQIVTPEGRQFPIRASVATEEGVLEGGSTKSRVLKALGTTALGAGLGAALGTAMGPLSGGQVGRGAIYGTAVGAGVGAIAAAAQKGNPVQVSSGEQIEIKLDQPLSIDSSR